MILPPCGRNAGFADAGGDGDMVAPNDVEGLGVGAKDDSMHAMLTPGTLTQQLQELQLVQASIGVFISKTKEPTSLAGPFPSTDDIECVERP